MYTDSEPEGPEMALEPKEKKKKRKERKEKEREKKKGLKTPDNKQFFTEQNYYNSQPLILPVSCCQLYFVTIGLSPAREHF